MPDNEPGPRSRGQVSLCTRTHWKATAKAGGFMEIQYQLDAIIAGIPAELTDSLNGAAMRLLSVNIGERSTQPKGSELEVTGIYKRPARGRVPVTFLGLTGDFIADARNHGGPDQAVFIYGEADYAWWSDSLGNGLGFGTFGENLTISGIESATFAVGDQIHVGGTILEVSAPRTPCSTLARRMGDPMFVKKYRRAERPGLYCRVIQEGLVQAGDPIEIDSRDPEAVKIIEIFREHYALEKNEATLRRFLQAPIAARVRVDVEKRLRRMAEKA